MINSFSYASKGLIHAFKSELNMKIHFVAMLAVLMLAAYLQLSIERIAIVVLTCAVVISLEILNTSIEHLVDLISPEYSEKAGKIKDIAAAAPFFAAMSAVVIAILVFFC